MRKFWKWVRNQQEPEQRELLISGPIAEESWYGDEVSPKLFRKELQSGSGDIVVRINSPGGDCIAASEIYTMLLEYKGNVTVKIDGVAASAASVVAMAGTDVLMSPTALMMIHNPSTAACGDSGDLQSAIEMLDQFKCSIINAYELKTGLDRDTIAGMMDEETWMDANRAMELGFCDGLLERSDYEYEETAENQSMQFSAASVMKSVQNKIRGTHPKPEPDKGRRIADLLERLEQIR